MVDLLIADVFPQVVIIKTGHLKAPYPCCHLKSRRWGNRLVDPAGGVCLDGAHKLRNRHCPWRLEVKMHVISNSSGTEQLAPLRATMLPAHATA